MTTAYTTQAAAFGRTVQWLVEIDLDRCALNYTTAPCTASDQGDGARCCYTFGTCQDVTHFSRTTKTWRFCLAEVPWDDPTYDVWPLLRGIVSVPQEVQSGNMSTYPESITATFGFDFLPPPFDRDKTLYNTASIGEFWRNLFARNRNYAGRPMRIKRGFQASGFTLADFQQVGPDYLVRDVEITGDAVRITAESSLAILNQIKVPFTISDDNTLQTAINSSVTSLIVANASEFPNPSNYTRAEVCVEINGNELAIVTSVNVGTNTLTVQRGKHGTVATSAAIGAKVKHVLAFNQSAGGMPVNVVDVMLDLLDWCGINGTDIETTSWDVVQSIVWYADDVYTALRTTKTVAELLAELKDLRSIIMVIDSAGKYALRAFGPHDVAKYDLTDEHCLDGSIEVFESEEDRLTRVTVWYDPVADSSTSPDDFNRGVIMADADMESANGFGDRREKVVFDHWTWSTYPVGYIAQMARRYLTRVRFGTRKIRFRSDLIQSEVAVGDLVTFTTAGIVDASANQEARACIITAKKEVSEGVMEFVASDLGYGGRFFRICPDTNADTWDTSSGTERTYGYVGDSSNLLGIRREPGFIFW